MYFICSNFLRPSILLTVPTRATMRSTSYFDRTNKWVILAKILTVQHLYFLRMSVDIQASSLCSRQRLYGMWTSPSSYSPASVFLSISNLVWTSILTATLQCSTKPYQRTPVIETRMFIRLQQMFVYRWIPHEPLNSQFWYSFSQPKTKCQTGMSQVQ